MFRSSKIAAFLLRERERIVRLQVHTEHRPSYQFCLTIIEQSQSLFDVICYTQLPTALNELYYRYGELTNFKRSIASTLGVTGSTFLLLAFVLHLRFRVENSRLISCPKLVKMLQQLLDDAKSNELITFKKMAKINDMNEWEQFVRERRISSTLASRAISKIRSYDDFVPYYHQFIEQMANLLGQFVFRSGEKSRRTVLLFSAEQKCRKATKLCRRSKPWNC